MLASKGFSIGGNTKHLVSTSYFPCRHLPVLSSLSSHISQSSVIHGYENVFMHINTRTNQTPKVRLVGVVCMWGNLGKPPYLPNLKITLIISKNSSLDFGIQVDYFARSLLEKRKGSEF